MIRWKTILIALAVATGAIGASAAIPPSERQVLIDLYTSTNGSGWSVRSGWRNGTDTDFDAPGTECAWFGVTCDGAAGLEHVTEIKLSSNLLTGTLPMLDGLTALQIFYALNNQLTGPIPPLAGLAALQGIDVQSNKLTGAIPSLTGLTALQGFQVSANQLTGAIPSLAGLTALKYFEVEFNQLTGSIPPLVGLTALQLFGVYKNQLTGSIPSLAGLTALRAFYVEKNQLTGSIPSLAGLISLEEIKVNSNQLTGAPPVAPSSLMDGRSALCPNFLATPSPNDAAWDAATTGATWSADCTVAPNYTITPSAGANGAIAPLTPQSVSVGTTQAFTITPNPGFAIDTVSGCSGSLSGNTFTTAAAVRDCTVSATFKAAAAPGVASIPTLGEWGLLLLSLLMAGAAALRLRRLTGQV